jgi:Zn-dependent metalloprotease
MRYARWFVVWSGFLVLFVSAAAGRQPAAPPVSGRSGPPVQVLSLPAAPTAGSAQAVGAPQRPDIPTLVQRLQAAWAGPMRVGAAAQSGPSERQVRQAAELRRRIGVDVESRWDSATGALRHLAGASLHPRIESADTRVSSAVATAYDFLDTHRELVGLEQPRREMEVISEEPDEEGRVRVRFAQRFQGIPVWASEAAVHLAEDGSVEGFKGAYFKTPRRVSTVPSVGPDRARLAALRSYPSDARVVEQELVVYGDDLRPVRLAWRIRIEASLVDAVDAFVDAQQGVMLDRVSRVHSENVRGSGVDQLGIRRPLDVWRQGGLFFLVDITRNGYQGGDPLAVETPGRTVVLDARNQPLTPAGGIPAPVLVTSGNSTSWAPPEAVSAGANAALVLDYYADRFGRSTVSSSLPLISVARVGLLDNAFFSSDYNLMVYGAADRYVAGADVVGHEVTHGVIAATAGLIYKNQSGALNEAFADIFGEMVESYAGGNDWIVGTFLRDERRRSMANPAAFGQPARFDDYVSTQEGLSSEVCKWSGCGSQAVTRSPNRMANWLSAAGQSRTGRFHRLAT